MSAEQLDLNLNLDNSSYLSGVSAAIAATVGLSSVFSSLQQAASIAGRQVSAAMPTQSHAASIHGVSSAAAVQQQQFSSLATNARVTGQSYQVLTNQVRALASAFPGGTAGAQQVVQSLQQLGQTSKSAQGQLGNLGASFERLANATGTNAGQITLQMGQLTRLFAGGALSTSGVNAMSDSLTTLAAKSGTSADQILSFSQAIGPTARAAGLGQTAVMGMATAFSQIGDQGLSAVTAVNKILNDLNQSVVTGSSQLSTYANIVGQTTSQFRQLYQANPSQALSDVVTSLGAPGGRSQTQLSALGMDSTRTQASLQAIIQNGGLGSSISTAINSYNNGSTNAAAATAMGTLADQASRVGEAAASAAASLGTPLLGPLTMLERIFASMAGDVSKISSSRPVQDMGNAVAWAGMPLGALAGAGLLSKMSGIGTIAQAVTSTPVRSYQAASMLGRHGGNLEKALAEAAGMSTVGNRKVDMERLLPLLAKGDRSGLAPGNGFVNSIAKFTANIGAGVGAARIGETPGQYSTLRRARAFGLNTSGMAAEGFARMLAQPMLNASLPTGERSMNIGGVHTPGFMRGVLMDAQGKPVLDSEGQVQPVKPTDTYKALWRTSAARARIGYASNGLVGDDAIKASVAAQKAAAEASAAAMNTFVTHLSSIGGELGKVEGDLTRFGSRMATAAGMIVQGGASLGQVGKSVAGSAFGAVSDRLTSFLSSPQGVAAVVAMTAYAGYSAFRSGQAGNQALASGGPTDINSVTNQYAASLGTAGTQVQSFSDALGQATLAANSFASVANPNQVTPGAQAAAISSHAPIGDYYRGSAKQIAAQIASTSVTGAGSTTLLGAQQDLLREGYTPTEIDQILKMVPRPNATGSPTVGIGTLTTALNAGVSGAPNGTAQQYGHLSIGSKAAKLFGSVLNEFTGSDNIFHLPGAPAQPYSSLTAPGGSLNPLATTKQERSAVDSAVSALGQISAADSATGGINYGRQEALRGANSMYASLKNAPASARQFFIQRYTAQQLGTKNGYNLQPGQIAKAGGLVQALMQQDPQGFGNQMQSWMASSGASLTGAGLANNTQPSDDFNQLLGFLSNRQLVSGAGGNNFRGGTANGGLMLPGALVSEFNNVGPQRNSALTSAVTAANLPQNLANGGVFAKAVEQMNGALNNTGDSASQLVTHMQELNSAMANTTDNSAALTEAQLGLAQFRYSQTQSNSDLGQQVQQQMQYAQGQIAATQAPGLSTKASAQDITNAQSSIATATQSARSAMQAQLEAQYQYQTQSQQSYAQYQMQVSDSYASYYQSQAFAQENFNQSQLFSQENFGRQITQQIQSQMAQMYAPYSRIQAQPVWDAQTLLVNTQQQNQAMATQQSQLSDLRKRGLGNNAISFFGLSSTSNAQQLAQMYNNVLNDPKLINQLNSTAGQRQSLTKALFTDPANLSYAQSLQNFEVSTAQSQKQFDTQQAQSRANFQLQLSQNQASFNLSMQDMLQNLHNSESQMTNSIGSLSSQVKNLMEGHPIDYSKILVDPLKSLLASGEINSLINSAGGDMGSVLGQAIQNGVNGAHNGPGGVAMGPTGAAGNLSAKQVAEGMGSGGPEAEAQRYAQTQMGAYGWNSPGEWNALYDLWMHESGWNPLAKNPGSPAYGIPQADGHGMPYPYSSSTNAIMQQVNWGMNYISTRYGDPSTAWAFEMSHTPNWYAQGGVFTQPTVIGVGEGPPEVVLPLDSRGIGAISQAMGRYLSAADAAGLNAGGHAVHYHNESYSYDHGVHVDGPITVQSQDPDIFASQLRSYQNRQRLGRGRGTVN